MWCDWSNSAARLAPGDLLLAPVRELGRNRGVDVRADLRVPRQLDRAAGGLEGVLQAPLGHVVDRLLLVRDVGGAVGVEALDGLHAPELAARALRGAPRDRLLVGVVDEVAAGGDLDAVPAGLEAVEEEALRDAVLRRRRLDRDARVDEDVRGAQALLARVDPEREVVQAPARAVRVRDVDQLVRGDRDAHPGAGLRAVVELDALVEPVAEHVLAELARRPHVRGEQVDVVEPLDRRAAPDVALRLVAPGRREVRWGDVALGLVEQLEDVAVRVGEAVGRPVPDVAVDPARCRAPSPRRRRPGARAPRGSRRAARRGRGRPAGPRSASGSSAGSRPSRAGTPSCPSRASSSIPSTSTKKRRLSSGFGVRSSACAMCATSWRCSVMPASFSGDPA